MVTQNNTNSQEFKNLEKYIRSQNNRKGKEILHKVSFRGALKHSQLQNSSVDYNYRSDSKFTR